MIDTRRVEGKIALGAALLSSVTGLLVLIGWQFDVDGLKRVATGLNAMNPASAVAFIIAGAALAVFLQPSTSTRFVRWHATLARAGAVLVLLIGAAKLMDLAGTHSGVDQWWFASRVPRDVSGHDHMTALTALGLVLMGGALAVIDAQHRWIRWSVQGTAILVGLGSLWVILAYAHHVEGGLYFNAFSVMAFHTAGVFMVLAAAILLSHTDEGLLAVFVGNSLGGTAARRLLPVALIAPPVLGWVARYRLSAERHDVAAGDVAFTMGCSVVFIAVVCWTSRELFRADHQRELTQAAVLDTRRFLRSTLDALTLHIAILDDRGMIIQANAAWHRFARENGLSHSRAHGNNYLSVCDAAVGPGAEGAAAAAGGIRAVIRQEMGEFVLEYPCHSPTKKRWFLMRVTRFDDAGSARVVVAHANTTDRKLSEVALRDSDQKFHQLADHLTDAFWIRSPDMQKVHYVSPAFERIWGRSVEALYARPHDWVTFIVPEDRVRVERAFALLTAGRESIDIEYRILRPDGEVRWVNVRGFPVHDHRNEVINHVGVVRDITDRKGLEAQLFQAQKLETAADLAGGIAHEFNSLLTGIIGQADRLIRELPPASPFIENANEINLAATQAAELTQQLLAYGRRQILRPQYLDLNSLLARVSSTVRYLVGKHIDVRVETAPGLHTVRADAGKIEQVVMNLAANSRDAMPRGGMLTLAAANVAIPEEGVRKWPDLKAGAYVELVVSDTGAGMSEAVKARLFEPFFTTKAVGQGTGLGLSTCYGIVRQSGGHIAVESELGHGTTFRIFMPQAQPEIDDVVSRPPSAALPRGTETILLVEIDAVMSEMAARLMRQLGYTVLTATDDTDARTLQQQLDTPVDVVLRDIKGISPSDLARRLRTMLD